MDVLADLTVVENDVKTESAETKRRRIGRDTGVEQAKIVRHADRVDALTLSLGKAVVDRGYGFVEKTKHVDANSRA